MYRPSWDFRVIIVLIYLCTLILQGEEESSFLALAQVRTIFLVFFCFYCKHRGNASFCMKKFGFLRLDING